MKYTFYGIVAALLLSACGRPVANFIYSGTDEPAPTEVTFTNKSEKAESYEWDFGDGNFSGEENPTHEYDASGNYKVVLKAKKGNKTTTREERVQIDAPVRCLVEIETPYGSMVAVLHDATPKHRDNFVKLAEEGFYDSLLFHRVIDGFMIQGGDPDSKDAKAGAPLGSGGPGYQVDAEFDESLAHVKGAIAAARIGGPSNPMKKSSGSQFYLVAGREVTERDLDANENRKGIKYDLDTREAYVRDGGVPFLDADYTVFGQVIEGLDVIDTIAKVAKDGRDRPTEDVPMQVRIIN